MYYWGKHWSPFCAGPSWCFQFCTEHFPELRLWCNLRLLLSLCLGAPGLGPISVRKELVVFKEGFRSRQYCLSECVQVRSTGWCPGDVLVVLQGEVLEMITVSNLCARVRVMASDSMWGGFNTESIMWMSGGCFRMQTQLSRKTQVIAKNLR